MTSDQKTTPILDARGMRCPMPVLRLRRQLAGMQAGDQITVYASDLNAWHDIPAFCAEAGHQIITADKNDVDMVFTIQKGDSAL